MYYPRLLYSQYTNHLFDLILFTLILYINKLTTTLSKKKIDSIQYIAALAITGAIRGSLTERMYQELSLESLQRGR